MSGIKVSSQLIKKFELHRLFIIGFVLFFTISGSLSLKALPSGGPYGPIRQTYDLPKVKGKIYYVAPDGKTKNKGEKPDKPTTIEKAIERVVGGDAIVMRGGTYRTGSLLFSQSYEGYEFPEEKSKVLELIEEGLKTKNRRPDILRL